MYRDGESLNEKYSYVFLFSHPEETFPLALELRTSRERLARVAVVPAVADSTNRKE